jgi:hypothetical protein
MSSPVGHQSKVFEALVAHRQNLSAKQTTMVRAAPQEQQGFLEAQFKLQNEMEATEMLTRLLKEGSRMEIFRNL